MKHDLAGAEKKVGPETIEWQKHVNSAVKKFLKTAVVIDDQPVTSKKYEYKVEGTDPFNEASEAIAPAEDQLTHPLDIVQITDAFISHGIACSFVLPNTDIDNDNIKRERALSAAKVVDLVVIDWFLKRTDPSLTLRILEDIAQSDLSEQGRLRLICIYTGQDANQLMLDSVKKSFSKYKNNLTDVVGGKYFSAKSDDTFVIILNKYVVKPEELPSLLIDSFSTLSSGLIPSFALASIGAIRNNTHHMLTRFNSLLDSAYVSNRLITNPPGDVAELMRELLVAECDNAIGLDKVADDFLEIEAVSKWLNFNKKSFSPSQYKTKSGEEVHVTLDFVTALLKNGVRDSDFDIKKGQSCSFPEDARNTISITLAGSKGKSFQAENAFSRLVAFRREQYGSTTRLINDSWLPSLTTGTVLKYEIKGEIKYLMCFTPACDTLRINEKSRSFVFIEGGISNKPYNLVLPDADNKNISVYFDKRHPVVRTFYFSPHRKLKRVFGKKIKDGDKTLFTFSSAEDPVTVFEWIGEIRTNRAMSEMAALANVWMRIGINDSEYLRLAAKDKFSFE